MTYHEENWALATEGQGEPTRAYEEPEGHTWICPRCAYPLDEWERMLRWSLYECAQCGWIKVVKGERA